LSRHTGCRDDRMRRRRGGAIAHCSSSSSSSVSNWSATDAAQSRVLYSVQCRPLPRHHQPLLSTQTDKYLDTSLANQAAARKALPPTIAKTGNRRWRTARVIISLFLPNQSQRSGFAEAGRRRSPMSVVCCNVEYLNFGMHNLRPSNVKAIFQRPSCKPLPLSFLPFLPLSLPHPSR